MKVNLNGLMVSLGTPEKLVPINSISLIEPVSDYYSNVYFKEEYQLNDRHFISVNMPIKDVKNQINQTIIKANKLLSEKA